MRGVLIVACTLAALTIAPAARADVTIGSDLSTPPNASFDLDGTLAASSIPGRLTAAPAAGVITRWRIRGGARVPAARLVVIRRPQGIGDNPGEVVGRSDPLTPPQNGVDSANTRLRIAAGEYIGLECCVGTPGDYLVEAMGPAVDIWTLRLTAFVPAVRSSARDAELLINADIEPDVDGDGRGDETQDDDDDGDRLLDSSDNCPTAVNPVQENADGDTLGDVCDDDRDGDGVLNDADVCHTVAATTPNGCPAPPRVNTPAIVRFRTPLAGTEVGASQLIELDVVDDFGTPTVTVFDDDGTVCTLRGAPYSCTWSPTGPDVGRATLLASAVDADNRSSLAGVRIRVARFRATLTRRVKGRRVTGKLRLPAAVEPALGCDGDVTVRRGKVRRAVKLKRNCTYAARLPPGRGRMRARFGGNHVVSPTQA